MHTVDYAHRGLFLLETMSAEDVARGRRVGAQKFLVHTPPRNSGATESRTCNVVNNSLL